MINQDKWINSLPNISKKHNIENAQVDHDTGGADHTHIGTDHLSTAVPAQGPAPISPRRRETGLDDRQRRGRL